MGPAFPKHGFTKGRVAVRLEGRVRSDKRNHVTRSGLNSVSKGLPLRSSKQTNSIRLVFQQSYSGHRVQDELKETENSKRPFLWESLLSLRMDKHPKQALGQHESESRRVLQGCTGGRLHVYRLSKREELELGLSYQKNVVAHSGNVQKVLGNSSFCFGKASGNENLRASMMNKLE